MASFETHVTQVLAALEKADLLRLPDGTARERAAEGASALGRDLIDASSNDYLGLASSDVSRETDVQSRGPAGAGASRLIHGTRASHLALEAELADWVGLDSALLFSTGYTANIGLLQAVGGPGVVLVSDALNHASIIDGCRLSRSRVEVVPHLSLEAFDRCLEEHRAAPVRCVVTESYFSMDGDGPDLLALRALCDRHDAALLVDEAHAVGVFGPEGGGRCLAARVRPEAVVGTLGKAVGVQGAFVAGSSRLRELLWNRARSFVFSTAPSPHLCDVARFHVQRTRTADGSRAVLEHLTRRLRELLTARGVPMVEGAFGPIVSMLVGDERRALRVADTLLGEGVLAQAIRPPTVPPGTARLRLTVKATWSTDAPEHLVGALARALGV